MPRTQSYTDPRETLLRADIGAVMGGLNISQTELARRAGIPASTFSEHIKFITRMTVEDLLAIQDVAIRGGLKCDPIRLWSGQMKEVKK